VASQSGVTVCRSGVPEAIQPYLPIAVVAALDAVFGGLRAYLEGIFDDKVFVVSFFSNVVIETSGGSEPVRCHGHRKRDAVEMKRLINQFQSEYYGPARKNV